MLSAVRTLYFPWRTCSAQSGLPVSEHGSCVVCSDCPPGAVVALGSRGPRGAGSTIRCLPFFSRPLHQSWPEDASGDLKEPQITPGSCSMWEVAVGAVHSYLQGREAPASYGPMNLELRHGAISLRLSTAFIRVMLPSKCRGRQRRAVYPQLHGRNSSGSLSAGVCLACVHGPCSWLPLSFPPFPLFSPIIQSLPFPQVLSNACRPPGLRASSRRSAAEP